MMKLFFLNNTLKGKFIMKTSNVNVTITVQVNAKPILKSKVNSKPILKSKVNAKPILKTRVKSVPIISGPSILKLTDAELTTLIKKGSLSIEEYRKQLLEQRAAQTREMFRALNKIGNTPYEFDQTPHPEVSEEDIQDEYERWMSENDDDNVEQDEIDDYLEVDEIDDYDSWIAKDEEEALYPPITFFEFDEYQDRKQWFEETKVRQAIALIQQTRARKELEEGKTDKIKAKAELEEAERQLANARDTFASLNKARLIDKESRKYMRNLEEQEAKEEEKHLARLAQIEEQREEERLILWEDNEEDYEEEDDYEDYFQDKVNKRFRETVRAF